LDVKSQAQNYLVEKNEHAKIFEGSFIKKINYRKRLKYSYETRLIKRLLFPSKSIQIDSINFEEKHFESKVDSK